MITRYTCRIELTNSRETREDFCNSLTARINR